MIHIHLSVYTTYPTPPSLQRNLTRNQSYPYLINPIHNRINEMIVVLDPLEANQHDKENMPLSLLCLILAVVLVLVVLSVQSVTVPTTAIIIIIYMVMDQA